MKKTCEVTCTEHERAHAHKVIFLNYQLVFANKILDSDFSGQNTPVVTALLNLQMLSRGTHEVELIVRKKSLLNFTNEIHDDNEDTTEDDVRNIRGDIVTEKVFGFYRTVRNDSDDVGNL